MLNNSVDNAKQAEATLKFVPTLANLEACLKLLPNPSTTKSQNLEVSVPSKSDVKLNFERIKYSGKNGVSEARWSYKGRVLL